MTTIKWKCLLCGDIITSDSKDTHQMNYCSCGASAIDLEDSYCRMVGSQIQYLEKNGKKQKNLRFYDGTHTYFFGRQKLTSVTTWVGQFFDKFDAKAIAKRLSYSPKYRALGMGMRAIMKEWKELAEHGTKIHDQIENSFNTGCDIDRQASAAVTWVIHELDYDYRQPEVKVYDDELGLAGMIDLLVTHEDHTVTLVDWKTNKQLRDVGYNNKKAKDPIVHLQDCNIDKYKLQLSTYSYILKRKGIEVRECIIVHIPLESAETGEPKQIIRFQPLYEEVEEMFKHDEDNE